LLEFQIAGESGNEEECVRICVSLSTLQLNSDIDKRMLLDAFKEWLENRNNTNKPIGIVYKLKDPVITDISVLLSDDNLIPVEKQGKIIFENAKDAKIPGTVIYQTVATV
jgi:hypothetical protein